MSSVVIAGEDRRPIGAIRPHPKQVIATGIVVRAALTTYVCARRVTRDQAPTPLRPAAAAAPEEACSPSASTFPSARNRAQTRTYTKGADLQAFPSG
jgi:hypothetical protein